MQSTNDTSTHGTVGMGEATEQAPVGSGAVNFDANVVTDGVIATTGAVEATPNTEPSALGNVRELGETSISIGPEEASDPVMVHTIAVVLNLTLNTGLTFLAGLKSLKSVSIGDQKFNFYNPFVRSDKERNTGEGLLRHVFGNIAKISHSVLGREAIYLGDKYGMDTDVRRLAKSVVQRLERLFPANPDDEVFVTELTLADGTTFPRHVTFSELFSINYWVVEDEDEESGIITHLVYFNIGLNIGAVYDSAEPHAFVRRAVSFVEAQLATHGLTELVPFTVNYAFDSSTLSSSGVRDTLEILTAEDGFDVVSKAAVTVGRYGWIPADASDKLFGFGCDAILSSPSAPAEEAAE